MSIPKCMTVVPAPLCAQCFSCVPFLLCRIICKWIFSLTSQQNLIYFSVELSPLELSAFLNALPCSLAFHRDTSFQFKDLIKEVFTLEFVV